MCMLCTSQKVVISSWHLWNCNEVLMFWDQKSDDILWHTANILKFGMLEIQRFATIVKMVYCTHVFEHCIQWHRHYVCILRHLGPIISKPSEQHWAYNNVFAMINCAGGLQTYLLTTSCKALIWKGINELLHWLTSNSCCLLKIPVKFLQTNWVRDMEAMPTCAAHDLHMAL